MGWLGVVLCAAFRGKVGKLFRVTRPVVITLFTGAGFIDELVKNNETGYLVKVSDVEEMAKKIEFILDNKATARNMGDAGKKRLMEAFNLEVMTNNYINLYRDCIKDEK